MVGIIRALIDTYGHNLTRRLDHIDNLLEKLMTEQHATQADIDQLTATVTADDAAIQSAVAALQAEIASLQGQGVDVSGLQAAVAQLTADAQADQPPAPAQ